MFNKSVDLKRIHYAKKNIESYMRQPIPNCLLSLQSNSLTDAELNALLPEIATLTSITELDLSSNQITGKGVSLIREFLPKIEKLILTSCRININNGCHELAQFTKLKHIVIASNNLKSSDIDELRASSSLLIVNFTDNPNIKDIVIKARLFGALSYNKRLLDERILRKCTGADYSDYQSSDFDHQKKDEYIRQNLEQFRKEVQKWEKIVSDFSISINSTNRTLK